ncbi:MAG: secretin and TonB N-terminal domain-containing protein, partial [bacterium]|nr:secretin and TonB N-terminal domain-containing protein [bacterium]
MVVTPAVIVTPAKAGVQSVFRSLFSVFLFSVSLFSVFCFLSSLHASSSLSDLAVEGLEREFVSAGGRNPFTPGERGEMDAATLTLEGLVYGKTVKMGLLSGQIVRPQDKVGKYTVSKIEPGEVVLTTETEEQHIRMEGYLKPQKSSAISQLSINFRQADIKDALRLLSTAADYNLIAPEDISGRVNVSFENTTLRDAINSILKVNGYNYAMESGIMRVGRPDQFAGGTDLLATTVSLKYATADDLVDKIKPLLSDKGSVTAEERTNTLSIKDYEANVDSVRKFVVHVDKKDQQVLIEAHIIDATNNFSRSLGVQWGVSGSPDRLTISGASNTGTFTINGFPPTPAIVNLPAASPTSGMGFRVGQLPGGTNI